MCPFLGKIGNQLDEVKTAQFFLHELQPDAVKCKKKGTELNLELFKDKTPNQATCSSMAAVAAAAGEATKQKFREATRVTLDGIFMQSDKAGSWVLQVFILKGMTAAVHVALDDLPLLTCCWLSGIYVALWQMMTRAASMKWDHEGNSATMYEEVWMVAGTCMGLLGIIFFYYLA